MKFINFLLQNHWTNFNQTWHKPSLDERDSRFYQQGPFNYKTGDDWFSPFQINVMIYHYHSCEQMCLLILTGFLR